MWKLMNVFLFGIRPSRIKLFSVKIGNDFNTFCYVLYREQITRYVTVR